MGAARAGPASGGGGGKCGRCRVLWSLVCGLVSIIKGMQRRIEYLEDGNRGLSTEAHEARAGKRAAEKQVREERKALVDMGADLAESRAREASAVKARDEAVREKEEAAGEMAGERSSHLCDQATLKARLELEAGRREQAAGGAGGARAGDLMSRPGLAVSTSLSSRQRQQRQAGREKKEVGDDKGGACTQSECARTKRENARLKRENAVCSGPDTPSGRLTIANMRRRKFRAIFGLAYRHGSKPKRKRGGQEGHKGCSNNDQVEALFFVPPPTECPDCRVALGDANPGTTRRWLRPGKSMLLGLVAGDERAARMLQESEILAAHGAAGRHRCVSVSFKRGECPCCGWKFERTCGAVIVGSGASREDAREVLGQCRRVPEGAIARQMRSQRGFPLKERAVRSMLGALRNVFKPHNARIPERIGAALHHRNDEAKMKGSGGSGGGGGGGGTILESAVRASVSKHVNVLGACTDDLVYLRFRTRRTKATLRETYLDFLHVPATTDEYKGQPCKKRQSDWIHRIRKAEHAAAEAFELLYAAGRMGADDLHAMSFEEWDWAGRNVGRIMGAPGSSAVRSRLEDGSPRSRSGGALAGPPRGRQRPSARHGRRARRRRRRDLRRVRGG